MPNRMNRLIVIVGPTAVGKTQASIRLAKILKTEIISADSRQVYSEMEIGTAKPTRAELSSVKHHFINCRSIHENYDAGIYATEVEEVWTKLFNSYNTLIMVGGSGLYIKSALEGFSSIPRVPTEIRTKIISEYKQKGLQWLQSEVKNLDSDYFQKVDTQNPQRLMRSLEVIWATNRKYSSFLNKKNRKLPFEIIKIGLNIEKEDANKKIEDRVDKMISDGLFEEALKLLPFQHLNALNTVGYKEIFAFFNHIHDRSEAIRLIKQNSRHFAKRQMTWFKKDPAIQWVNPNNFNSLLEIINQKPKEL